MVFLRKIAKICAFTPMLCLPHMLNAQDATADLSPLKGYRMYCDSWRSGEEKYGFCLIPTDGSSTVTELTVGRPDLVFSSGGALTDNGYLGFNHQQMPDGQPLLSIWYRFDAVTFEEIEAGPLDYYFSVPAMTYDPVSHMIYSCTADFETGGFFFGALDPATLQLTNIADIGNNFWFAMAADGHGVIYAIDNQCNLIKINPEDGSTAMIGATGVNSYSPGSMAIDPKSGRCFWTVTPSTTFMGSLYEIDLESGKASHVCTFPDSDEFTGIYFDAPADDVKSPGAPEDLTASFPNGSLSAKIIFTVPVIPSDDSDPDSSKVQYSVTSSGGEKWTGSASSGDTVTLDVEVAKSGEYTFSVQLANDYGTSPIVKSTLWIGFDIPEPIHPEVVCKDGMATVSWEHPAYTLHNGLPVDPADMSYRVKRLPDNVLIGVTSSTSVTDLPPVPESDLVSYSYTVTALYDFSGESYEAQPESTGYIVLGTATLPYLNDFANQLLMAHFTVVDADNDGASWVYNKESGSVYAAYGDWVPKNDWLVSPLFTFEEGKHYILNLDVAAMGEYNPEELEIVLLSEISPEAIVSTIMEPTPVTNPIFNGYETVEATFTAPSSGGFYIGLHAVSNESSYYLYVDNFSLSSGIDSNSPATPEDITVVPAEDGSSSLRITGIAPSRNFVGEELDSQVDILVYRDGELAHTVSSIMPGNGFDITDSPVPGRHDYRILASNEYGQGRAYEISAFVGINSPKAPEGIVMFEDFEIPGRVHIGWEAPTEDRFGQPLDGGSLHYAIMDIYGNVVAENITDCSYSVDALPAGLDQLFARFAIYAVNEVGVSETPGYTPMMPIGFPIESGWTESFANGELSHTIGSTGMNITDEVQWIPTTDTSDLSSADNDNGFISMQAAVLGLSADLITPKCHVSSGGHLDFFWNGVNGSSNTVQVYAVDGMDQKLLKEISIGAASGWQKEALSLGSFEGKDIHFIFRGNAISDLDIQLDRISLSDSFNSINGIADESNGFELKVGEGWLSVKDSTQTPVSVYTVDGHKMITFENADGTPVAIASGIYVVTNGTRTYKVVVR